MSDQAVADTATPDAPKDPSPKRSIDWASYLPSTVTTLVAFVLAMLIGAVLIIITDQGSLKAIGDGDIGGIFTPVIDSYKALWVGSVGRWESIGTTLTKAAPLICAGLGVGLAFRAGLFNIGAQGQLIAGAMACGYVGFTFHLPPVIHLIAALAAGLVAGALWGGIAGFLKARTGAHEVIVTMMLNYVAYNLLDFALHQSAFQRPDSTEPKSPYVDSNAMFPEILGVHSGVLLVVVAAVAVWWLLERSTWGFEMRAVGANPNAARTAGMSIGTVTTWVMLISGGLAGLAGVMQIQGEGNYLSTGTGGSIGFDAITVALLGRATPLGTVLAGLLFGALNAGSVQMQASADTSPQLAAVIQALIVMFVAAPALVKAIVPLKVISGEQTLAAKGWGG